MYPLRSQDVKKSVEVCRPGIETIDREPDKDYYKREQTTAMCQKAGETLGIRVNDQRQDYKQGNLSEQRIKRPEDIGP